MASPLFSIPLKYQDKLEEVAVTDTRSDDEILASLREKTPVTSEKNLWGYWDSGIDTAPGYCKRNVCDWVRILGPEWTVRILDKVPGSPNHALKWIPAEMLPEAWHKDTFNGPWIGAHSADCLRGALLYLYGGCYTDVGTIMLRHLDRAFWDKLEDPASPYEVAAMVFTESIIGNGFIASRKGNTFIKQWHDLFIYLWRDGRTSIHGVKDDPVLTFVKYAPMPEGEPKWKWTIPMDQMLEYVTQSCCWVRMTMLEDTGHGFNAADYWLNNVLCFEHGGECLPMEETSGYDNTGEKVYKLLSMRIDVSEEAKASEDYKQAEALVWGMLADYTIEKLGNAKDLLDDVTLAVFWRDNPGSDSEPGTFAHLLRYGSVHFRQKRESIRYIEPHKPALRVKRGLLEPPPPGEPL